MDSQVQEAQELVSMVKQASATKNKEGELWRLVNGLKKKGIHLSESTILEMKRKRGIAYQEDKQVKEKPIELAKEPKKVEPRDLVVPAKDNKPYDSADGEHYEKYADYDPYRQRNLQGKAEVERARMKLIRRKNTVNGTLIGALLGALGGGTYGLTNKSVGGLVGGGVGALGGAAIGGISTELANRLLYGEFENDLGDIAAQRNIDS